MKRTLASLFLVTALTLTACGNESVDSDTDEELTYETEGPDDSTEDATETSDENSETASEDNSEDTEDDTEEESDEEETTYLYEVNQNDYATVQVIDGEEANEQVALLTYDDAPDKYALDIAEVLAEHDAPAIFFVNGMYAENEEGREMLKEIYDMGFAIGNHTHTHPSLPSLSEEEQTEEIMKTSDLVEEITGERPRFFRAPFGQNTDHAREVVEEDGMILMNWTYGYDWEADYMEAEALADIMVNTYLLRPGANLLMHDREWTLEATPAIIEGLREKDYELVNPDAIRFVENEREETE
ncbi:polysaccharide deacetylase family protein [Alkalibacterium sp.]|nr:MAG: polysaccharide deacetylase family protein [Alkalibacterium sp.]